MRVFNISVAMTLAASTAYAQQELFLEGDEELEYDDDEDLALRSLQSQPCKVTATGPESPCWLRSDNYQAQTRQEKLKEIEDRIAGCITEEPVDLMWTKVDKFFTQRANGSFCIRGDELNSRSRPKTTHTQGLVARVAWEPVENDLGYTAIYESGSDTVILRISEMANLFDGSTGLTPSVGLKFLIDGQESYNIMAMEGFLPTESWNFLDAQLTNRLKPFDTTTETGFIMDQTFRKKLVEASQRPFGLGIGHIGKMRNDGSTLDREDVKVPYQLYFRAPEEFRGDLTDEQKFDEDGNQIHWVDHVRDTLSEGDVIYEVYAQVEPFFPGTEDDELVLDDKLVMIAEVKLLTDLQTSRWGDEKLFFQHRQINRDRRFWPLSWKRLNEDVRFDKRLPENTFGNETPEWPQDTEEAKALFAEQMETFGCPFEWLMPEGWIFLQ
uniref:Uncharacterized protein n=3 Tax=Choreotrichia TaxID=141411 RepID=A0A7S3I4L1_9SPIT|mmetsp:Transcript_3548/g.4084  ORF Transcript_3548/g.4084 Transcript_3548/m.4084 type:complete len:439 (+) Transcript_3548:57-1373(+)